MRFKKKWDLQVDFSPFWGQDSCRIFSSIVNCLEAISLLDPPIRPRGELSYPPVILPLIHLSGFATWGNVEGQKKGDFW